MDSKGRERGILKSEIRTRGSVETRLEAPAQGSVDRSPGSPQPSVDRLSVTWAEPTMASSSLFHLPAEAPAEVKFSPAAEGSEDEDYSASLSAVLRQRRASVRRSRKGRARRPSSPFLPDERPRRRSSVFTTSSGDTAISMEEVQPAASVVTQEQIFENIHLHKEVLGSVKQQPLGMRRKLKLVHQAKAYIKRHEGQLQERLAQSKSTRDIYARFNILLATKWQQLKREAANTSNLLIPWELRIKEIESHFGSVVASYFTFLRWLFWVNLVIAFILLVFVIVPEYLTANPLQDGERKIIMEDEKWNATKLLTLWEFEGILKFSPIFYGYYSNLERPQYRMPLAYFLTGLVVYIYSFVAILRKMAENSRMSKLSEKEDECVFSWKLFTGWDFMIGNAETAHNRIASVILGFKEALLEEAEKKKDVRNWRIISLRAVVNICVVILLAVSAYAVVTVVSRSDDTNKTRSWLRENETTIVVTVISITFPVFFELLGFLEHYHPRKQLRLQLARIMLLNLLNLYSLIFALFSKIEGMSRDLDALKPTLSMNATIMPNNTLNISESLALNVPLACFDVSISCAPCNEPLTISSSSDHADDRIISNVPSTSTLSPMLVQKSSKKPSKKTVPNTTSVVTKKPKKQTTLSTKTTPVPSNLENKIENPKSIYPQNLIEQTTTQDPIKEQLEKIRKYTYVPSASEESTEEPDSGSGDFNYDYIINSGTSSVEINTGSSESMDDLMTFLSIYNDNSETDATVETINGTDSTVTTDYSFYSTESTNSDVTLYSTTGYDTDVSTIFTETDVSTESTATDYANTETTSSNTEELSSYFNPTSYSVLSSEDRNNSFPTTIKTSDSTTAKSAQTETTTEIESTVSEFTYSESDSTTDMVHSTTDISTALDTVTVCPNISFNCSVNCAGRNVTQVFLVSNCTLVQKMCYVKECRVLLHPQTNATMVDIVYKDEHNRKMYNLTIATKKKLLKLCWETMFGQELVKLTMMDLVFVLLGTLFMDFFRSLFVRYMNRCWCWDLEKKFPEYGDFKIAENILHLINNQGMVWMGMFFSPGLVVLNVCKLMIMMYLRSWAVMTCNVPHEVVFRVSKSNNFYLALLLTMLFLCVLPVGYTIVWVKPSWHCGPFSEYDKIYYILTSNIYAILPKSLNFALEYIASPAIVIPLLVLLILIIYYLTSLTNSLREANNDLKIQLRRERTEERRKMFQLADTRRRAGSSALDNTPFARWKKALPALPLSKSIDSDERKPGEDGAEPTRPTRKRGGIFSKIVGMALAKKEDVLVTEEAPPSPSPSPNTADDETDTDFHETLPKEVLKFKDITFKHDKKRNNVEFKTEVEENKQKDKLRISEKDDRSEKRPISREVKEPIPEERQFTRKSTSDSNDSKESDTGAAGTDSLGSVIPVITISTTESDDEILHKKTDTRAEETKQKYKKVGAEDKHKYQDIEEDYERDRHKKAYEKERECIYEEVEATSDEKKYKEGDARAVEKKHKIREAVVEDDKRKKHKEEYESNHERKHKGKERVDRGNKLKEANAKYEERKQKHKEFDMEDDERKKHKEEYEKEHERKHKLKERDVKDSETEHTFKETDTKHEGKKLKHKEFDVEEDYRHHQLKEREDVEKKHKVKERDVKDIESRHELKETKDVETKYKQEQVDVKSKKKVPEARLRRQSSVDSSNDPKERTPKEKKDDGGHKYQYSL